MSSPSYAMLQLIVKYNDLLTRFARMLNGGNQALADDMVKRAMEEAYDENKFYDTPELRSILKNKIIAKAKSIQLSIHLN
ncbi:MAG: hypothetical protein H7Y86_04285 [Rhizobacter sp.]|nr:hypothetical protein [Ferruginibacter sp.]